ncbi:hypothetical protein G5V59_19730 [Nocardioides sp. W3-2-3]|uniref:hypothetical protein n=1 Tax=Nocardioides convexus TaxID=2712224 RepID=UPI00241837F5|nr:hypothetical protein [Nocardioides convexus]NHA01322.1 hypothetical protein [Nocardioides convexus]
MKTPLLLASLTCTALPLLAACAGASHAGEADDLRDRLATLPGVRLGEARLHRAGHPRLRQAPADGRPGPGRRRVRGRRRRHHDLRRLLGRPPRRGGRPRRHLAR